MESKNLFELNDDMLDAVAGGVEYGGTDWAVGDKACVTACSCCGERNATGTLSVVNRPKRGGVIRVDVSMDCCGGVGSYTLGDGISRI